MVQELVAARLLSLMNEAEASLTGIVMVLYNTFLPLMVDNDNILCIFRMVFSKRLSVDLAMKRFKMFCYMNFSAYLAIF